MKILFAPSVMGCEKLKGGNRGITGRDEADSRKPGSKS